MKKANTTISIISAVLVLFLASSAFLLSFDALQALAVEVGIEPKRAWLYPAIIDGAVIIFSLSVLRANLSHDKVLYPWVLVSAFTFLSIVLNIVHAQRNFLAQLLGAIPPIALFLSFELLMSQIKAMSIRAYTVHRLDELVTQAQNKTAELDVMTEKIGQLGQQKETLSAEVDVLRQQKIAITTSNTGDIEHARQARASKKALAMDALLVFLSEHPNASLSEMATSIGRSKSTAGVYVSELKSSNRLHKNGHGWEVMHKD